MKKVAIIADGWKKYINYAWIGGCRLGEGRGAGRSESCIPPLRLIGAGLPPYTIYRGALGTWMGKNRDVLLPEALSLPEGIMEGDTPGLNPSSAMCLLCDLG